MSALVIIIGSPICTGKVIHSKFNNNKKYQVKKYILKSVQMKMCITFLKWQTCIGLINSFRTEIHVV